MLGWLARHRRRRTGPSTSFSTTRGDRGAAFAVVVMALLVRAAVLLDARDAPFWRVPIMDETAYVDLARGLLAGVQQVHGAFYVAPGYAYFLALVFAAGGGPLVVKLLQVVCGAAGALLVFLLARRMCGRRAALAAGLAWALYPAALLQDILLLKSSLTVSCTLAALAAIALPRRPQLWQWLVAGVGLGAAVLLRGELVSMAAILVVAGWLARWRRWPGAPAALGPALAVVVVAGFVAVPTYQNWKRSGDAVVLAYGGGTNFYIGNSRGADGSYVPLRPDRSDVRMEEADAVQMATAGLGHAATPSQVSRYWWRAGLEWWRHSPIAALRLTGKKWMLLWGPWELSDVLSTRIAARWIVALRDPLLAPWLFLPAALAGLWMTRRRRDLWPLHAFVAGCQIALVPFFLFDRFRLHFVAGCLPFAAAAGQAAVAMAGAQRWRRLGAGVLGTAALAGVLAIPRASRDEDVLRINIGEMLFDAARYDEALREFEAVRAASPDAWRVDINIANTLAGMGRLESAVQALQRVLPRLYDEGHRTGLPSNDEIVYCEELAADIEFTLQRFASAAQHYEAALRLATPQDQPELRRKLRLAQKSNPP